MNSAGRTAATPISTIIRPSSTSCGVMVRAEADVHVVGVFRFGAGQRALLPQAVEIALDHGLDLEPGRLIVGFEHRERARFLGRFLDRDEQAADRDIAPLVVVAGERPAAPDQGALAGEIADGVDRLAAGRVDVELVLVVVGDLGDRPDHRQHADVGRALSRRPARGRRGHRCRRPPRSAAARFAARRVRPWPCCRARFRCP